MYWWVSTSQSASTLAYFTQEIFKAFDLGLYTKSVFWETIVDAVAVPVFIPSYLVFHRILICLSKHFLPQIFISYQSSLFNFKKWIWCFKLYYMHGPYQACFDQRATARRSIMLTHAGKNAPVAFCRARERKREERAELSPSMLHVLTAVLAFHQHWAARQYSHCECYS